MAEKKIIEIAQNKKAYHDYDILDTIETGIALKGTEIKSVREHNINLKDSYVVIRNGEALVMNMHISPYGYGNIFNHDPKRTRRLLLHKKEILKLSNLVSQKGIALIPLKVYIKGKYAKLLLGIAKGKKIYSKKEALKEKDIERDIERELKNYKI
ncbi:MAG: SsrA-binding protein SmpB [Brevinematia bacterium]